MVATTQHKYPCPSPASELLEEKYKSDEFRLYCFKVLPCSQRKHHDWTKCPFAHVGERAKRRSLRTHVYDCEMCPAIAKGEECSLGASCPHSHNAFESWLHPQKYRTLLCKDSHKCDKYVCFFAHGVEQLRAPSNPHTAQPLISHLSVAPDNTFPGALMTNNPSLAKLGVPGFAAQGSESAVAANPTGSGNIQTVALLMEQVQQARKMAQESRDAAAHAEMQLKAVTNAMFSHAGFGSNPGFGVNPMPQLAQVMPAVSGSDAGLMPHTQVAGAAVQSMYPGNSYLELVVPSSAPFGSSPGQGQWAGQGGFQLGGAMSGVLGGMLQAPANLSGVMASSDMGTGVYGSSPGSTMSLPGMCDLAYPALGAAAMQRSQSAALSMFMQAEQQPQMVLHPAASAGVLCQVVDGELLQGSPCSSSTAYYF